MRYIEWRRFFAAAVIVGCAFQVGHFIEHLVQFGVWLSGEHKAAYMSPAAMLLSHSLGQTFFPEAAQEICPSPSASPRQMMMGMEILHLMGNSIFLATLAGLYRLVPSRFLRYALYVEGFHLYEHVMLTVSAAYFGTPVGLSTLFGAAKPLGGQEFLVGYRVSWHFVMNLVPSLLIMPVLMPLWRRKGEAEMATVPVAG